MVERVPPDDGTLGCGGEEGVTAMTADKASGTCAERRGRRAADSGHWSARQNTRKR